MTTYTSGLRMTNQPTGGNPNTWGSIADDNFEFIDDALTGRVSVDLTGTSSHTLTVNNGASDEARYMNIYIHGALGSAQSVICPASEKMYLVDVQASGNTTTFRTATGTGVVLNEDDRRVVYCDGTSVWVYGTPEVSALDPSNNLNDVENVSATRDNLGLQPDDTYLHTSGTKLEFDVSALFDVIWPIGSLYSNRTDGTNPGTLMGFGTWTSAGLGRVPIGVGTGVDVNGVSVTISAQTCGGEYEHVMTTAEMVKHQHTYGHMSRTGSGNQGNLAVGSDLQRGVTSSTGFEGSSSAFNIQQPWYSVYQWVRTA